VPGRIAVIEDEEPSREFLRQLLSGAGFSVGTASGGQEGIALIEREYPDLVIGSHEHHSDTGVRQGSPYRDVKHEAVSAFASALRGLGDFVVVDLGNQISSARRSPRA